MEKFKTLIKDGTNLIHIIDAYDFEEGLSGYFRGVKDGIAVMVSHPHKGFLSEIDQAKKIANHLDLPFLSVNEA